MKTRCVAIVLLIAVAGLAQNQTPGSSKANINAEQTPLWFAKTAAVIAINTQHLDLNGYAAAYIDQTLWGPLLKDKDAGPFLKLKEAKPGRKLVMLISNPDQVTVGMFFDEAKPTSVAVLKPGENAPVEVLKELPKDVLKDPGQTLTFENGDLASDDGQAVPAFNILVGKKPN
jgi:hypothetical protein